MNYFCYFIIIVPPIQQTREPNIYKMSQFATATTNTNQTKVVVEQGLSLMIPRVFPQWVDEQLIIDIFERQKLGRVYKVSIIHMKSESRRSNIPLYKAIVYFSVWYDNIVAYNFQQRIFAKGNARVIYDDPWYWVAVENKHQRLSNNDKRIMRVAYQNYLSEQNVIRLTNNIRGIKAQMREVNRQLLVNSDMMSELGDDNDGLSDTAIQCAMNVLYDE